MKKLPLFAIASICQAATLGVVCSAPPSTIPPFTWNCTGVYTGGGAIIGGTITTSQPAGPITITAAGTAIAAAKQITANGNSFVEWGLNRNVIADGTVLQFGIPVLANTPAGVFTVTFAGAGTADPAGTVLATTVNAPASIMLTGAPPPPPPPPSNPCDLTGDGKVDVNDVIKAAQDWLATPKIPIFAGTSPTTGDVQKVINGITGACAVGPVIVPPLPPPPPPSLSLTSFACSPAVVLSGANVTCTVQLSAGAPAGGAVVALSSIADPMGNLPASVTVPAGSSTVSFSVVTIKMAAGARGVSVDATLNGVTKTATFTAG